MFLTNGVRIVGLGIILLGCGLVAPVISTPQPTATPFQLSFDIETATSTATPLLLFADSPTNTPDPNATPTPELETSPTLTATLEMTAEPTLPPEEEASPSASEPPSASPTEATPPTETPVPTAAAELSEPLRGGVWDFEEGFHPWANPYGEDCAGAGLATGWNAFTSQDQFGSSCMNQTTWASNVYSGISAQEITFAYVGVEAGIFKTAPTIPGHQYKIIAFAKRESSPATVIVSLGVDLTGGTDWQAESVQWFPWDEEGEDIWTKTEEIVTATGEQMTIFIKGHHPFPEPGGALRLDTVSVEDLGPG